MNNNKKFQESVYKKLMSGEIIYIKWDDKFFKVDPTTRKTLMIDEKGKEFEVFQGSESLTYAMGGGTEITEEEYNKALLEGVLADSWISPVPIEKGGHYPYIVTRVFSAVYNRKDYPKDSGKAFLIAEAYKITQEKRFRACVVFGPNASVFVELDGSMKFSHEIPSGGFQATSI